MYALTKKLLGIFELESSSRVMLYSVLVGVVSGLGAALFFFLLDWLKGLAMGQLMGFYPPAAGGEPSGHVPQDYLYPLAVLLVPTVGGLVCGILVYSLAPEAEGHGTDAVVGAFHRLKGVIRGRVPFVKAIASIVTIGTGGSAGREGPIAQIGAGFGSFLATKLRLSDWERRHADAGRHGRRHRGHLPRAGRRGAVRRSRCSTPARPSSSRPSSPAWSPRSSPTRCSPPSIGGRDRIFTMPSTAEMADSSPSTACAKSPSTWGSPCSAPWSGFIYVWFFYESRDRFFRRIPIPNHFKPAIGGLMLGALALVVPQIMAGGYGWIQKAIDGHAEHDPRS